MFRYLTELMSAAKRMCEEQQQKNSATACLFKVLNKYFDMLAKMPQGAQLDPTPCPPFEGSAPYNNFSVFMQSLNREVLQALRTAEENGAFSTAEARALFQEAAVAAFTALRVMPGDELCATLQESGASFSPLRMWGCPATDAHGRVEHLLLLIVLIHMQSPRAPKEFDFHPGSNRLREKTDYENTFTAFAPSLSVEVYPYSARVRFCIAS